MLETRPSQKIEIQYVHAKNHGGAKSNVETVHERAHLNSVLSLMGLIMIIHVELEGIVI